MSDLQLNESGAAGDRRDGGQALQLPGAQLAAARQARGWSIEQVASQINLAPRQIQAIESDNYAALPGMPIARGFIRSYAKLLRVDPEPLLAAIPGESAAAQQPLAPRRTLSTPFSETRLPSITDRRRPPVKTIVLPLVVVALLAGIWGVRQAGGLTGLSQAFSSGSGTETIAVPVAPPAEPAAQQPDAGEPVALDSTDAQNAEPAAPVETPAAAASEPNMASPVPVAAGKDTLVLKVHEDSWIEIRRPDNSTLISRLVEAGSTETFEITEPVSMVVGNAVGVDATLRGKPLELKANTSNNVARLSLK